MADAHKWMAILVGARSDLQPIKERIQDGQLFKHHVDIAISIDPADSSLHHMVGRFCYEVAGLKWFVLDDFRVKSVVYKFSLFQV